MGLPLLISDYRQKKILKRYKVTPTSPAFLLVVWVAIYAIYSVLSLLIVFGTVSLFFCCRFNGSFGGFLLTYILVMPSALQKAADILPLTQGIKMLKAASLGLPLESVGISSVIMFAFVIICGGIAVRFFKWE